MSKVVVAVVAALALTPVAKAQELNVPVLNEDAFDPNTP